MSGNFATNGSAVDGILGLGQGDLSVISQLSLKGLAPKVFSHCLRGDEVGGGTLVLGEILNPNIVFSPLVTNTSGYTYTYTMNNLCSRLVIYLHDHMCVCVCCLF